MKKKTLSKYEMIMNELNYKTIGGYLLGLFSVSNSVFKCNKPELQPYECEKYKTCKKCPHYIKTDC